MLDKLYAALLALTGVAFGGYIMLDEVSHTIATTRSPLPPGRPPGV
ncbi:hypothetical protein [Rhodococcus sp. ACS1]|nr:hypothetical protein [Rhodococcus sp. ACS1]